jgi:hypothetical protein
MTCCINRSVTVGIPKGRGPPAGLGNFHPFNRQGLIAAVFQQVGHLSPQKLYASLLKIKQPASTCGMKYPAHFPAILDKVVEQFYGPRGLLHMILDPP